MQETPLKYMMADQYYLDHSDEYSSIQFQENQYLVNLNQNDVPIFQSKLIKNPTASLIGNYCLSIIHQIDPLFATIRVFKDKFLNILNEFIKYEEMFDRQNPFQEYLCQNQYIRTHIDNLSDIKYIDDQLYIQLNKNRLFEYLDQKYDSLVKYMHSDGVFQLQSCHSKEIEDYELQNCKLFYEYIGKDLFLEYYEYKQTQLCEKVTTMTFSTQFCTQLTRTLTLSNHSFKDQIGLKDQGDVTQI
ncbi:unnamed protein product [Paramecium primaurelia]|uniref:Uncharacterized protein n=1 Tax=Paramecium primaurelia TaxID=5886 RepID=A0A8S1MTI1_PARPR|nr:unnamed protein product [Paramecium primaurelia]